MTNFGRPFPGVVCDDRTEMRHRVAGVLGRSGYRLAEQAGTFDELLAAVDRSHPAVVVLTLPVAGASGLVAVTTLRERAPWCAVVVVSSFAELQLAALEAGAVALVHEDDPVALHRVLLALRHQDTDPHLAVPAPRSAAGS